MQRRVGLTRLGRYLRGRWALVGVYALVAALAAAGPVIGLLLVQDAIDNGMRAGDTHRLALDVAIYLVVNVVAWVLMTTMIKGLARLGPLLACCHLGANRHYAARRRSSSRSLDSERGRV